MPIVTESTTVSPDFLPLTSRESLPKDEWVSEISAYFKAAEGGLKTWEGVVGILVENSDLEKTEPGSWKSILIKNLEPTYLLYLKAAVPWFYATPPPEPVVPGSMTRGQWVSKLRCVYFKTKDNFPWDFWHQTFEILVTQFHIRHDHNQRHSLTKLFDLVEMSGKEDILKYLV